MAPDLLSYTRSKNWLCLVSDRETKKVIVYNYKLMRTFSHSVTWLKYLALDETTLRLIGANVRDCALED